MSPCSHSQESVPKVAKGGPTRRNTKESKLVAKQQDDQAALLAAQEEEKVRLLQLQKQTAANLGHFVSVLLLLTGNCYGVETWIILLLLR